MIKYNPVFPNSGRRNGKYSSKQVRKAHRLIKKISF